MHHTVFWLLPVGRSVVTSPSLTGLLEQLGKHCFDSSIAMSASLPPSSEIQRAVRIAGYFL